MSFYNRHEEQRRLTQFRSREKVGFAVLYGRRRCGKSTLLRRVMQPGDIYVAAVPGTPTLQRRLVAAALSERFPVIDDYEYQDWNLLLKTLTRAATGTRFTLFIDEFPYLAQPGEALPGLLQNLLDNRAALPFNLVLCGSSQRMMHEHVLSGTAPLYGRADEILKIRPLQAGWLSDAFPHLSPIEQVIEYSVWGGVPRYWELRQLYDSLPEALKQLLFGSLGLLIDEPNRLLLDDLRDTLQPISILTVVANGAHRLSEIAGRLGRQASDLSRNVQRLIALGYLRREVPYKVPEKNAKRVIYRLDDNFLRFYYRFVYPNKSVIGQQLADSFLPQLNQQLPLHTSYVWEELSLLAAARGAVGGVSFSRAQRWWGKNKSGAQMEIDAVGHSTDGKQLLVMECKWSSVSNEVALRAELLRKARLLPFYEGEEIIAVVAAKEFSTPTTGPILTPQEVLAELRF